MNNGPGNSDSLLFLHRLTERGNDLIDCLALLAREEFLQLIGRFYFEVQAVAEHFQEHLSDLINGVEKQLIFSPLKRVLSSVLRLLKL